MEEGLTGPPPDGCCEDSPRGGTRGAQHSEKVKRAAAAHNHVPVRCLDHTCPPCLSLSLCCDHGRQVSQGEGDTGPRKQLWSQLRRMQLTSPLYTRSSSTLSKVTCAFQSPVQTLPKPCSRAHCPSSAEGLPVTMVQGSRRWGAAPLSSPPLILRAPLTLQPQGLLHNCPTACTLPAARGQDPKRPPDWRWLEGSRRRWGGVPQEPVESC